mmetsp:Transcript_10304/g.27346  ORF Transcript_10304/g.27346 Transcript_10304/m.27346 type:complete len:210 (+) Transcript_10304:114-743(+)
MLLAACVRKSMWNLFGASSNDCGSSPALTLKSVPLANAWLGLLLSVSVIEKSAEAQLSKLSTSDHQAPRLQSPTLRLRAMLSMMEPGLSFKFHATGGMAQYNGTAEPQFDPLAAFAGLQPVRSVCSDSTLPKCPCFANRKLYVRSNSGALVTPSVFSLRVSTTRLTKERLIVRPDNCCRGAFGESGSKHSDMEEYALGQSRSSVGSSQP